MKRVKARVLNSRRAEFVCLCKLLPTQNKISNVDSLYCLDGFKLRRI